MIWIIVFEIMAAGVILCAIMGESVRAEAVDRLGRKVYVGLPMESGISIGYGVLRLFPSLKECEMGGLRHMCHAKTEDTEIATKYWDAFLASLITGAYTCLLGLLPILFLIDSAGLDRSRQNILRAMAVLIAACLPYYQYRKVKVVDEVRNHAIKRELPNAINKMVMFLSSGLNMTTVLRKLGSTGLSHPLYEEFRMLRLEMDNNVSMSQALTHMKNRCPSSEMVRLYLIVEQNITKGTDDCNRALQELAISLWHERNEQARREGAKLKEKLLIPAMLLFILVIILCMVSALDVMNGFHW